MLFSRKMGILRPRIIDQRLVHLTPHMFPCHKKILGFLGRQFIGQKSVGVSLRYYWKWLLMLFSTKMWVVWPLIIDQRLVHLTPHMFSCQRSHSWIFGGGHYFIKNPLVLAFGIIQNGRSCYFGQKWGLCGHLSSTRGSYTWLHICFLAIDNILGFLVETISWVSLRYYWKWSFMAIFGKNGGCVAIDHWLEACSPHTTYVSLP
jgi:hypothetical protein